MFVVGHSLVMANQSFSSWLQPRAKEVRWGLASVFYAKKKEFCQALFPLPENTTLTQNSVFSVVLGSGYSWTLHCLYLAPPNNCTSGPVLTLVFASALIWPPLSERLLRRTKREGESEPSAAPSALLIFQLISSRNMNLGAVLLRLTF